MKESKDYTAFEKFIHESIFAKKAPQPVEKLAKETIPGTFGNSSGKSITNPEHVDFLFDVTFEELLASIENYSELEIVEISKRLSPRERHIIFDAATSHGGGRDIRILIDMFKREELLPKEEVKPVTKEIPNDKYKWQLGTNS